MPPAVVDSPWLALLVLLTFLKTLYVVFLARRARATPQRRRGDRDRDHHRKAAARSLARHAVATHVGTFAVGGQVPPPARPAPPRRPTVPALPAIAGDDEESRRCRESADRDLASAAWWWAEGCPATAALLTGTNSGADALFRGVPPVPGRPWTAAELDRLADDDRPVRDIAAELYRPVAEVGTRRRMLAAMLRPADAPADLERRARQALRGRDVVLVGDVRVTCLCPNPGGADCGGAHLHLADDAPSAPTCPTPGCVEVRDPDTGAVLGRVHPDPTGYHSQVCPTTAARSTTVPCPLCGLPFTFSREVPDSTQVPVPYGPPAQHTVLAPNRRSSYCPGGSRGDGLGGVVAVSVDGRLSAIRHDRVVGEYSPAAGITTAADDAQVWEVYGGPGIVTRADPWGWRTR